MHLLYRHLCNYTQQCMREKSQLEISPFQMGQEDHFFSLQECVCAIKLFILYYICLFPCNSTGFGPFQMYKTYIFMAIYMNMCLWFVQYILESNNIVPFPSVSQQWNAIYLCSFFMLSFFLLFFHSYFTSSHAAIHLK